MSDWAESVRRAEAGARGRETRQTHLVGAETDVSLALVDLLDVFEYDIGEIDWRRVVLGLDDSLEVAKVDLLLLQLRIAVVYDLRHEVIEPDAGADVVKFIEGGRRVCARLASL